MSITCTIPNGVRARVELFAPYILNSGAGSYTELGIWVGTVNSGTRVSASSWRSPAASYLSIATHIGYVVGTGSSVTINAGINTASGGTASIQPYTPSIGPITMRVTLV